MRLLWQYIQQQRRILLGALVLATINQVFSLLDPQIFRLIVDRYASKAASLSYHAFF
jgi:ATP-binding cassette subfamily B protein